MQPLSATERRSEIIQLLAGTGTPVSATMLARKLAVSRQIIVGDVALLRAGGSDIFATPRGYVMGRPAGVRRTVACIHRQEQMGEELTTIVDAGGEILDVVVEHPVYGQLTGELHIRSRHDVAEFLKRVEAEGARPLSDLTGGIHLHTLCCPDEGVCARVLEALGEKHFLLET